MVLVVDQNGLAFEDFSSAETGSRTAADSNAKLAVLHSDVTDLESTVTQRMQNNSSV